MNYLPPSLWSTKLPVDIALSNKDGTTRYAVLDAVRFPSDPGFPDGPDGTILEDNHVMFKLRSDSADILRSIEGALFDNPNSGAYIGDLFDLTSKRMGFLGRGFGSTSVGKQLALAAGVPSRTASRTGRSSCSASPAPRPPRSGRTTCPASRRCPG